MEISKLKGVEIRDAIINKKISAQEVLAGVYKNIEQKDKKINAFISLNKETAIKKAEEIDKKIATGAKLGKLCGIPIAVKDNMCIDGGRTTCASKILENFIAPYSATVVEKIVNEDAIIIGKTNMDEFAMGSSTETSYFGPTKNPVDLERIPGGSSGGSAAAVAAGFVTMALGSDTGGSIRQPASLCGVYGLKPTYGRVSRYGLIAFASSLDQIGPFAGNSEDAALLLEAISGKDKKDSTSVDIGVPEYSKLLSADLSSLRVGLPKEYFAEGLNDEVRMAIMNSVKFLEENGAKIKEISLPHTDYAVAAYYIIAPSEASSNLARYDGVKYGFRAGNIKDLLEEYLFTREQGFGAEVKRRIMLGTYTLSSGYYDAYYLKAQKVRTLLRKDYEDAWKEVDVIITPTAPTTAFKLGEKTSDPLAMYLSDIYTISVNLAGIPAISTPCGRDSKGLPIGLQIIAPHFKEELLLAVTKKLEGKR
ncbi:MAG: Asp-tRNA(Asn)/Glu-tRNA(Gln) amidotransferase subunit GatA [Elusimicrobiota bacterium]